MVSLVKLIFPDRHILDSLGLWSSVVIFMVVDATIDGEQLSVAGLAKGTP